MHPRLQKLKAVNRRANYLKFVIIYKFDESVNPYAFVLGYHYGNKGKSNIEKEVVECLEHYQDYFAKLNSMEGKYAHDVLERIFENPKNMSTKKSSNKTHNPTLRLAGKLAIAARLVTTANVKNLSRRIEELEVALDDYDNEIMHLSGNKQ